MGASHLAMAHRYQFGQTSNHPSRGKLKFCMESVNEGN
jgi:hypothetical protein